MKAITKSNCPLINLLITLGADVNARQGEALVHARRNLKAVKLLISHKADPKLCDKYSFRSAPDDVQDFLYFYLI